MEMNSDLTSRLPLKQHLKNIKKVGLLLHELDRKQFGLAAVSVFWEVAGSYLTLLLSAWVLNGITGADFGGGQDTVSPLLRGCLLFLTGILLCRMVNSVLTGELNIRRDYIGEKYLQLVTDKITDMDFSIVDSPVLKSIRLRIQKDNNWGAGIYTFLWGFDGLIRNIFSVAGAVVIGVPVLIQIFESRNLTVIFWMAAVLVFALVTSRMSIKKEAYLSSFLLRDMFETPEEMAQKAGLIWPFAYNEIYDYQNGKDVRLYDADELFDEYTYGRMRRYEQEFVHWGAKMSGKKDFFANWTFELVRLFPYLIVALAAYSGGIAAGNLVSSAGALSNLFSHVSNSFYRCNMMAVAARKQLSTLELLELADEMYRGKLPVEKRSDNQYEIEFDHVWFSYPGTENYALRDFCFKMRVGEKLAIVGMNGSGKTTMIKLLCRLYEPSKGQIRINGVDIRKFDMKEYRQLFSVVFQDLQLFSLKLGENVAGGREYDADRVHRCLEDAGFGERLSQLSGGLDSYLYKDFDDDGIEISGGEAQKIAIARALYKDAPFVLLDEPTAALDPVAEYEIYSRFDQMVGSKTAIYISHRLSSCRFCDDIAVFHEGQLVQRGSHEELVLQADGKYYELWQAQAQYYQ